MEWLSYNKAVPASFELEGTSFVDEFDIERRLEEAGIPEQSSDANWWLNSGALLVIEDGEAKTAQGEVPILNPWRSRYAQANPLDTDGGRHPQNLFRLLTRHQWENTLQELHFTVYWYRASETPNRRASNGVFLMSRYADGDNLYYLGLRVDGHAVIKKKRGGIYYTLTYEPITEGVRYDRNTEPNLLPLDERVKIRAVTQDTEEGVLLELYHEHNGAWELAARALDDGIVGGPILEKGRAGIRSDFMDLGFDRYSVHEF
jgi:hypothetical protein